MLTDARAIGLLMTLILAACGDSGGSTADTAADTAADTTADTMPADTTADTTPADTTPADTAPPGATIAFQFVEKRDRTPVPDVLVAWIAPGGERVEVTTDANGRVELHGVDWSKGNGTAIGLKAGYNVSGAVITPGYADDPYVDLNDDGDVLMNFPLLDDPSDIDVNGRAVGMLNEDHNLIIAAAAPGGSVSALRGPAFTLSVPAGTAFDWAACEWAARGQFVPGEIHNTFHQWAMGSSPGGADDYALDVDFGTASISPSALEGTFPIFASDRTDLDETGYARVNVYARSEAELVGYTGSVTDSAIASGIASYRVEWIAPEWATSPVTEFELRTQSEGSIARLSGFPTAGSQDIALPIPSTWSGPTNVAHPIDEPLSWTDDEPTMDTTLLIYFGTGPNAQRGAWFNLPVGTSEFRIPVLPGGYDLFEDGGFGLVSAALVRCERDPAFADGKVCKRWSLSKRLSIGPAAP